jgi:acyl-CoA reductase-like NAD-dependent aldehyde dehydrogenase
VVLKPAESTPIVDPDPGRTDRRPAAPGVLNVVNGYGRRSRSRRWPPAPRIAKIAFTGETSDRPC